jgi:hypothetical protein
MHSKILEKEGINGIIDILIQAIDIFVKDILREKTSILEKSE